MKNNQELVKNEKKHKINNIYNQCVMFTIVAFAIATPWIASHAKIKPAQPIKLAASASPLSMAIAEEEAETFPVDPIPDAILVTDSQPKVQIAAIEKATPATTAVASAKKPAAASKNPKKESVAATPSLANAKKTSAVSQNAKTQTKAPAANIVTVTIDQSKIDTKFLAKVEGVAHKAYVPLPKTTKSGVTIAAGLDLGQLSVSEFNKLPMDDALRAKLLPYIGLKKFKATAFLKAHPLHLSTLEVEQLNIVAANMILMPLSTSYYKSSGKSFAHMPSEAQTALFSFAYQYGSSFMKKQKLSVLWNHFVTEDWAKAEKTLKSFKIYGGRRKQEASLLAHL